MKLHTNVTFLFGIFIFMCSILTECNGANILFFFGVSTYSHRLSVWPLVEKLAENGHQITFMTAHPSKTPLKSASIKEFAPKAAYEYIKSLMTDVDHIQNRELGQHTMIWDIVPILGMGICDVLLKDPETLQFIKISKFDLVVIDSLWNECGIGLAYLFGAKHMIFGTTSLYMWHPDSYGTFAETSWIPDMQYHPPYPMTFLQRISTTLRAIRWHIYREWYMLPYVEKLFRNAFPHANMPSLSKLEKNVSLVFMNTHYSQEFARSLPPLVVSVGGMHCVESKTPLPPKILEFIEDGQQDGFILVSFGSAVSMAKMGKENFNVFVNAFKNSKTKFIWKLDGDSPKNLPKNIFAETWMPQQDILAHPKIKGFITHGGLLGIQEAIFNSVPMILFPFFAEQDFNSDRVHSLGIGIKLEITTVSQSQLETAINSLLTENSYRVKIQELSKVFKDRPMKPLDLAVWWTEYILRHEDDSSLRPLSIDQSWYERRLLDVWGVIFITVILIGFFIVIFFRLVLRKVVSSCRREAATNSRKKVHLIKKEKKKTK